MPDLPLRLVASGKVRELYAVDEDHLLLVASDRISAYDVVLPTPVPDKGAVLTGLSLWWFGQLRDLVPDHLVTADVADYPAELAACADALRGRGVGQALVERAVLDARREGFRIIPLCPFARAQFERHPAWRDVLST